LGKKLWFYEIAEVSKGMRSHTERSMVHEIKMRRRAGHGGSYL
jgi:hypothetical protein